MIEIPRERVNVAYSRSGGPGGQNVNKVETKAEIRFVVADADWIPDTARARLAQQQRTRINGAGEMVISASRHRTRSQNLEDCFEKLSEMLRLAATREIPRVATKPTKGARRRRLEGKHHDAKKKQERRFRGDD